jgi:hypothetical protein
VVHNINWCSLGVVIEKDAYIKPLEFVSEEEKVASIEEL